MPKIKHPDEPYNVLSGQEKPFSVAMRPWDDLFAAFRNYIACLDDRSPNLDAEREKCALAALAYADAHRAAKKET